MARKPKSEKRPSDSEIEAMRKLSSEKGAWSGPTVKLRPEFKRWLETICDDLGVTPGAFIEIRLRLVVKMLYEEWVDREKSDLGGDD